MSVNNDFKVKNVSRNEMVEALIKENGCPEEDAQIQASLSSSRGLIIKGIRYIISSSEG